MPDWFFHPRLRKFEPSKVINTSAVDVHVHSFQQFQEALSDHEPYAIEVYFTPITNDLCLKVGKLPRFELNKSKLRSVFSQKASVAWVKAKKKLIVEADRNEWVAKKSLFHAIRLLDFGIQIGNTGKIENFGSMNYVLDKLEELPADWEVLSAEFKSLYNSKSTEFKIVCPK